MKNIFFSTSKYLFYFSFIILLILYLFPGSLIGYFLYGNLGKQPDFISNPIGTSINHLVFFFYLSILGFIFRSNQKKFINSFPFLFLISIILELFHYFIPNIEPLNYILLIFGGWELRHSMIYSVTTL